MLKYFVDEENKLKLLDEITDSFFSGDGSWKFHCFNKQKSKEYKKENLPCHLRDIDWLTRMFSKEISNVSEKALREYISKSPYFDLKRKEYEQKIVAWQINWMRKGGSNWIVAPNYGDEICLLTPKCDYAFRDSVVATLLAIGMDKEAIEEGIEKDPTWRDHFMYMAFENAYNPHYYSFGNRENLTQPSPEHREKWRKMRLYEYYIEHKESVEKYGEVLSEMKMSLKEVEELKKWLEVENEKRLNEIKDYREYRASNPSEIKCIKIFDESKQKTKTKKLFKNN